MRPDWRWMGKLETEQDISLHLSMHGWMGGFGLVWLGGGLDRVTPTWKKWQHCWNVQILAQVTAIKESAPASRFPTALEHPRVIPFIWVPGIHRILGIYMIIYIIQRFWNIILYKNVKKGCILVLYQSSANSQTITHHFTWHVINWCPFSVIPTLTLKAHDCRQQFQFPMIDSPKPAPFLHNCIPGWAIFRYFNVNINI